MDKFLVHGGRRLRGTVRVSGAKNAVLPIMAACLMAEGKTILDRVPRLADVDTLALVLGELGMQVRWGDASEQNPSQVAKVQRTTAADDQGPARAEPSSELHLQVLDESPCKASYDLVRRMRASVCVLGPLVAKRGRATVSLPGGCNLGHRPIELHLKGLRALGAQIEIRHGYVEARAERLHGAKIYLGGAFGSTVTGTCNVMMAATLAEGTTTIESAACEPEVVDLGRFLCAMGARIEGLGTPRITVHGVRALRAVRHAVIPDRIEAATLLIAAGVAGDDVVIEGAQIEDLTAVVEKLRETGVIIDAESNGASGTPRSGALRVQAPERLRPADVIALPYPGLPTDVQAQMTALLSLAGGISIVTDKIFPDRFMHVAELARLGAQVRREGPCAIISGVSHLSGAAVMASDLRASAALVLAGLTASGTTTVRRIYHLDRGYERLDWKLQTLGAHIERVPDEGEPPAQPAFLRGPTWLRPRTPSEPQSTNSE